MNVFAKKINVLVMAMVAVVLTASSPRSDTVLLDSCDYVEINHVYNINEETGEFVLRMTQYIWWEWKDRVLLPVLNPITKQRTGNWKLGSDFVVREYLVTYSRSSTHDDVLLSKRHGKWTCIFWDKGDRAAREIKCKWLTTTHTSYDVEIENRAILKQDERNHFQKR
jgi:hypothetical protein